MANPAAVAASTQALATMDPALQLIVLMASLSLLPFVIVSMTSFLRYIVVLSILKTALGTQQVPPAMVLVGMALIMTLYTMSPVFSEIYQTVTPLMQQNKTIVEVLTKGSEPLKQFMMRQTRETDVEVFVSMSRKKQPDSPEELGIWEVAPAFMLSELRTSFEIGFLIFIPFVVLDLVVANILLALGMMMLSPTIISLPFKILIFVAVDGWSLIVSGLVKSFN
ncbi:MAG: flagellar type III secretion system pore protein FliP [Candidatus Melainabacteria bacterium]|nr:flagellar type III secretion system pore protein FliP [Candidatus Melainabacteria bacterium]